MSRRIAPSSGTLDQLKKELDLGYPLKFVEREYLPTFDFRGCIAIVVVGRDGLVANAAKYVGDLPIVAVNPDPQRIDGVLLPFHVRQARQAVQRAAENRAKIREVTLGRGQSERRSADAGIQRLLHRLPKPCLRPVRSPGRTTGPSRSLPAG